jgi:NADH:ubiquinone oxidoreductase subunit E
LQVCSGETSPDGRWTLLTTSCLGVCGVGPVIIIDEDIFGNVQPEQVADILARYA